MSVDHHHLIPEAEQCMPYKILHKHGQLIPNQMFAEFEDGNSWTYGEFLYQVKKVAARLKSLGIPEQGRVVVWLPNGPEMLVALFAINYIGAVFVPINTALKGRTLASVLDLADSHAIIAHHELIERLRDIAVELPTTKVQIGGSPDQNSGWLPQDAVFDKLWTSKDNPTQSDDEPINITPAETDPWSVQSILFTSGTTGVPKAVLQTYMQQHIVALGGGFLTAEDRFLMTLPIYHQGGFTAVNRMFSRGGCLVFQGPFKTGLFWEVIRQSRATSVSLLGGMATFLLNEPVSAHDKKHTLRSVVIVPLENHLEFGQRFGVDVYSVYNMTELGAPLESEANPPYTRTCGRCRPEFELRIVDENDMPLPTGQVGELVVRSYVPWALTAEYYKSSQETAKVWRNGWFHTGDLFKRNEEGYYFFEGRLKEVIRRRGENISAIELEQEILDFPNIQEVAVVAVPSEISEDDILAVVVSQNNEAIDPGALIEFLQQRVPYYMVPRFIRQTQGLPKTPSFKIQKHKLQEQGITPDTWDREKHGYRVRRENLA